MAKAKNKPAKNKPAKKRVAKKTANKKTTPKKGTSKKVAAKKSAKKVATKGVAKKKAAVKKATSKRSAKKQVKVAKKPTKKPLVKNTSSKKAQKKTFPSVQKSSKPSRNSFAKLIHPLGDRLVVRVEGPSERTAGGLYIPATVEDRPNQGEVLACGPGGKSKKGFLKPLDVKIGDRVLFGAYVGVSAEVENEEVLILREEDILGVLS